VFPSNARTLCLAPDIRRSRLLSVPFNRFSNEITAIGMMGADDMGEPGWNCPLLLARLRVEKLDVHAGSADAFATRSLFSSLMVAARAIGAETRPC
jgi:hypothetical protein